MDPSQLEADVVHERNPAMKLFIESRKNLRGTGAYRSTKSQELSTYVGWLGHPHLFITLTLNQEWDELKRILPGGPTLSLKALREHGTFATVDQLVWPQGATTQAQDPLFILIRPDNPQQPTAFLTSASGSYTVPIFKVTHHWNQHTRTQFPIVPAYAFTVYRWSFGVFV